MLELVDVSVRLGGRTVLDGVSMRVPPGQVVGLLGPNGAGKTTAMRVMLGVLAPERGEVRWAGRRAGRADRVAWGYMTQQRALYQDMRVGDQLVWFGRVRGLDREEARARAGGLLERLGLGDRIGDRVDTLSGGMQQRVHLAASLIHEPPVIVLDEPFAGLDPVAVEDLSELISARAAAGAVVVLSSHQLDLVEHVCASVVLLHRGRVVMAGDVAALRAASAERQLRLEMVPAGTAWLAGMDGVEPVEVSARGLRLRLAPATDPFEVLEAARRAGTVTGFGLELPTLSHLFRTAVQDQPAAPLDGDGLR